jgi:hypothetical protein
MMEDMSAHLMWEPTDRPRKRLPDALKYALERSPAGRDTRHFGEDSLSYLEGLRDAGVEGAQELIDAIENYGDITVTWED